MIINIIGLPASGKTTLCEIVSKIDEKYDIKKLVVKDTDEFLNSGEYDISKINEYLGKNENKDIIFCGISEFLLHLKNDSVKDVIIVHLKKDEMVKNCKNRFFNKIILFQFFILSYTTYLVLISLNCKNNLKNQKFIKLKDNEYNIVEVNNLEALKEYKDYTIMNLKPNIIYYNSFDQLDEIILLILNKCDIKNITKQNINEIINEHVSSIRKKYYSMYILKFILLLIFYIPSYRMKKVFIFYPLWTFFLPTFGILESLNILFLLVWIKQNKQNKKEK